ncbi:YitT family protein [Neglectibacter caecimuris]|uniref:YitT family protein n=1 Tax=Neglectibacter caecimuris TaxID=3093658 RepID=UPI002AC9C2DC|nr:YitT family protein [Neglectibacter sp. M00184]
MEKRKKVKEALLDFLFILAGSVVYALSVNAFTSPNRIAPGGVTGLSTLINYVFGTPIGLMAFFINIPIILWAILEIGYKLVIKTMIAIVVSSLMIDLFSYFIPAYRGDMLLVALFAGICEGVGLSLTFIRGATTGGTDMLARLLGRRLPHLSMGKLMLVIDGVIVVISAFVYGSIENAMYACIVIFVSTKIIDAILYGTDSGTGKLFFVMSPKVRSMGDRIIKELDRTVTYLDSHGGYTKEPGETMICAVRRFEVYQIQSIIREEDRDAFVIVGDAGEITGEGFRPVRSDDKPLKELLQGLKNRKNA